MSPLRGDPTPDASQRPSLPIHSARDFQDRQFVTALSRGLEVLRCFSADRPELGTQEIARRIGLSQPTVWRLCYTLSQLGYLVPGTSPGKLRVGAPAIALGAASLDALEYTEIIKPHLQRFVSRYPAAIVLAAPHQMTMIYLLRCDGDATFMMKLPTGSSVPLASTTLGCACLAGMAPALYERYTAEILATKPHKAARFRHRVAQVQAQLQARGFATSYGEVHASVNYVATPLMSTDGTAAYALLCGGPAFDLPPALMEDEIGPGLVRLAGQLRAALPGARESGRARGS